MSVVFSLINIIIIDLVLSGDNAIIIGMATKNLPDALRKKAIMIGIAAATIMRIVFAFFAVYLLGVIGLKLVGALLLLYVVRKFYKELRGSDDEHTGNVKQATTLGQAVWVILIADISLSLDNVLAVAGAAHGNLVVLGVGLLISVILMGFASNAIAKNLNRYPRVQRLGLLVILGASMGMLFEGSHELTDQLLHINILPWVLAGIAIIFAFFHDRYLEKADEQKFVNWLQTHYVWLISLLLISIFILLVDRGGVHTWLFAHPGMLYTLLFVIYIAFLEIIMLQGGRKRIFKRK